MSTWTRQLPEGWEAVDVSPAQRALGLADEPVARTALRVATVTSAPWLYSHLMRTFAFARGLAGAEGVTADEPVLLAACVLHDIGLTEHANGDRRFEVDGAVAAHDVMLAVAGAEAAATVWTAIALHNAVGVGGFSPQVEVRLLHDAVLLDAAGVRASDVPEDLIRETFRRWPRMNYLSRANDVMADQIRRNPAKAPPFTMHAAFAADVLPDFPRVAYGELFRGDPWEGSPLVNEEAR